MSTNSETKYYVPIWEKQNLTINEASAYTGIGVKILYRLTSQNDCPFVLWVGNRRLIKRKMFDDFIENTFSV